MGRIVGSRSLQRLKDALTVYRTGPDVVRALEQLGHSKALNKLDLAVKSFLLDPLGKLELLAMFVLHENILSPLFAFVKNVAGGADGRMKPARGRTKRRGAASEHLEHKVSQYDVILNSNFWQKTLAVLVVNPQRLLDLSATMVFGGQRVAWDSTTLKKRVFMMSHVMQCLDTTSQGILWEVILQPHDKPTLSWRPDWMAFGRATRNVELKTHLECLLKAVMPFLAKMFDSRFAAALAVSKTPISQRNKREVQVWRAIVTETDATERSFAQFDYYCTRSTVAKPASISATVMANTNDPIAWLSSLDAESAKYIVEARMPR